MKSDYDIIIVGGGLAGLSLSSLLGQQNKDLNIICLDQAPAKTFDTDLRTTAISYGSSKILESAGIWPLPEEQMCPIDHIDILDGQSSSLLEFLKSEVQGKSFGWIVENIQLRKKIAATIKSLKNVAHISGAKVLDFEISQENALCHYEKDGKTYTISAKLIAGCDGRNSFTRKWIGVPTRQWSYSQRAVICSVAHENPHNNVAVEHFWPEGPFAVLPMTNDDKGQSKYKYRSSVVFTEHGPEKDSWMTLSDQDFETALAVRFPRRYGDIKMINKRVAYPLGLVHAAKYTAPRMVLVADAAHGIHPIAGQGLNLGFRDIKTLSDLIQNAHANNEDIGSEDLLKSYERKRRPDNMAMVAMTDSLNRLFSNNIPPIRLLRRIGLKAVARIPAAKSFFMKKAMGDH